MTSLFVFVIASLFLPGMVRGEHSSRSYLPPDSNSQANGGKGYSGPTAVPEVLADGTIAETAEVAAARAFHLAALAAARASDPDMGRDDGEYDPKKYGDDKYGVVPHHEDLLQTILSYQSLANPSPVYGVPGAGMQTLPKAMIDASAGGAMYGVPAQDVQNHVGVGGSTYGAPVEQNKPYDGPLAMLHLLASGFLSDTPEVTAARNVHLKALQEAQAAVDLWRSKKAETAQKPWG